MSLKILVKLVALMTALTATVVAIYWLKAGHMNAFWTSLGVDRSGSRLNWCDERVGTLYIYRGSSKLTEKDGQWFWIGETEKQLDYLRVEKWFARYCQIPVDEVAEQKQEQSEPIFEANFINGTRLSVYQYPSGHFLINQKVFKSKVFEKGLKELLDFGEENQ